MGLVGYSDSEGSDSEPSNRTAKAKPTIKTPAFQGSKQSHGPKRITVNLAVSGDTDRGTSSTVASTDDDAPPPKRTRMSGAFGGFNAALPAPKSGNKALQNHGSSSSGSRLNGGKGAGLGSGISLKTGAAPAFTRDPPPLLQGAEDEASRAVSQTSQSLPNPVTAPIRGNEQASSPPTDQARVVPAPSRPKFMPLSVSRNARKKSSAAGAISGANVPVSMASAKSKHPLQTPEPLSKSRVTLFSTGLREDDNNQVSTASDEPYKPLFGGSESNEADKKDETGSSDVAAPLPADNPTRSSNNLENIANDMNLTASQRRQLFGRNGMPGGAQVAQFNLAAEYSHNRRVAEDQGSAPMHNPVRSVAPGKHSLQQLMNNVSTQGDALDESFAAGRRNKKEAGNKYGW